VLQAGTHFDEDVHAEAGKAAVEFSKLPTSEEEASGSGGGAVAGKPQVAAA
jgi:hypothetical protein